MSDVFFYKEFNDHDLGNDENPLRKKFNAIIKDFKENKLTHQGSIKLVSSKGGVKYLRAKLSDEGRLLFTQTRHNNEDVFVMLEVLPHHDYENSRFLKSTDKIKSIEIKETETEKSPDKVEIKDLERAHWLGKLVTFSATQEGIVKRAEECKFPLIISGAAGSGKTTVALESLKKIQEKFEGGKILYITKSENLIKESKKLFECNEAIGELDSKEIDFLSIHKFLEKLGGEVKGKKPIDRNKFFSWFNEICKKDKFKEYKKDGDKIFEEFTAVIAGRALLKGDSFGKDQYKKELGKKESIFPESERDSIYDFFQEYRKFIEGDPKCYDPNLIVHKCTEKKIYDAVVVDEVQDLTESTLNLILRSLKDEGKRNFLLCGDVNQVVHPSFFSLSKLKSFFCQSEYIKKQELETFYTLEKNYRNSEQVIEVANRILHFKNYCFGPKDKITEDEKKAFFMKSNTKNTGNVSLISKGEEQKEIAEKVSGSTNWAILVLDDESKEDARKLFDTPLVFNIHEAKGLEFENVILYKFFSNKAYNEIWNRVCPGKDTKKIEEAIKKVRGSYQAKNVKTSQSKDKEDKSLEEYKFYMNALYVGASRAINGVYIMDDEEKHNLLKVIKPKKIVSVDIKKEESSPEEWRNKALELIDKGNIQAKDIAATKLSNKKEYAEEIMKKSETKEYHVESDKDKQELKTESQKSSTMVPNEKRKQSPSKKKKLTKRELERNADKLFLALKNGNLRFAEQLIEQGVNVNARDQIGSTLLHFAVGKGTKGIVDALLEEEGIDVNATNKEGWTPLHVAAKNGSKEILDILLKKDGINVNSVNKNRVTPLHLAVHRGDKRTVHALLEKNGINFNAADIYGLTPLHAATEKAHEEVVDVLLRKDGIKINEQDEKGWTPLHCAAHVGSKRIVSALLGRDKININQQSKDGSTPLHVAARGKSKEIVNALLRKDGIKINEREKNGATPLYVAAHRGNKEIVDALLQKKGIDVNVAHNDGIAPLDIAVQKGHKDVVELLRKYTKEPRGLEKSTKEENTNKLFSAFRDDDLRLAERLIRQGVNVNAKAEKDLTLLHFVAYKGHKDIAELFLQHKEIDVNVKAEEDLTPLHLAARYGHRDVVELLLKHEKIDINARSTDNHTPLDLARLKGYKDIVELLYKYTKEPRELEKSTKEENTKKLFLALDDGNLRLAEQLIEQGVNVNAKGQRGFTSLHFSTQLNYYSVVKRLLSSGANVNAQDEKNWTPLHFAVRECNKDTAGLLLQNKADVNAKAYDGTTPLHLAAEGGYDGIVRLLLEYRAEVNVKTQKGFTPLHLAANRGHKDVVELLLKHEKIDVNTKTQKGSTPLHTTTKEDIVELLLQNRAEVNAKACDDTTPLHVMANRGLYNVVKLLLNYEAKVDAKNKEYITPLYLAAYNGHGDVVQLLLAHGAKVNVKNKEGFTPLDIAEQCGYKDVAKLLRKYIKENSQPQSNLHDVSAFRPSNLKHGF